MDTTRSCEALSYRQSGTAPTYAALTSSSTNFYRCTYILALEVAHTSPQLTLHVARAFLFCMGTHKANQATHRDLLQTGGGLAA
eukprot:12727697-Ditylum_brightwellii.AAC.1